MVADIVEVVVLLLAVLLADENAADVGLAYSSRAEGSRVGQYSLQELKRNYLPALVHDRLDGGHSDVLKALEVSKVALTERHEEADTLDSLDVQRQGFQLLVVQQVHILFADALEVVYALDFHGLGFYPLAVLNVASVCGYLADIYFRVEVGSERITMVAAVAV